MDSLEYNGKVYRRRGGKNGAKWADQDGIIASLGIQQDLNKLYIESLDLDDMSVKDLIKAGDESKNNASYGAAIRFYEKAVSQADANNISFVLPRLTSCYRKQGSPEKAIELLVYANNKYGPEMITAALLVSVGAAYCDLKDIKRAEKCAERASKELKGKESGELYALLGRIKEMKKN